MNKIQHVDRLADRLAEAESEAVRLGEAAHLAEAAWSQALAEGDTKAEKSATVSLDGARAAYDAAVARVPLMKQALQDARAQAMTERLELAIPEIERVNAEGTRAADKLLEAVRTVESAAADITRLEAEHRRIVAGLRAHAVEAGKQLVIDAELRFPASHRDALAVRHKLATMRLDRTLKPARVAMEA